MAVFGILITKGSEGGIVIHLQPDPESIGHGEKSRQAQTGIGSDRSCSGNDFTNAPLRHTDFPGQPVLGYAKGFDELFQQYFSRMRIGNFAHFISPLMIINDLNILRTFCCPYKAYSELIVDPDTALSGYFSFQGFQPVPQRNSQVIKLSCAIEHC
jgi:hypothetical protein